MLNTRNKEKSYGILFIVRLLCEYMHLDYVRIHVIYSVHQAEYVIHILVVTPQEYLNISTRRVVACLVFVSMGNNSLAPGRAHGHSYFITRSTNVTAIRVSVTIS